MQAEEATERVQDPGIPGRELLDAKSVALYEAALDDLDLPRGARVLDLGCGSGLFLRLAAFQGAQAAGIDADARLVDAARRRLPGASLAVGDLEALPWPACEFDAVTSFGALEDAADSLAALREAARTARPGAPVLITTWGPLEACEAAACLQGLARLAGLVTPAAPLALAAPGALEALARAAGLAPARAAEIPCAWCFPDEAELVRALSSTSVAIRAARQAGASAVTAAILEAAAPFRTSDGGCRLENVFTYLIANVKQEE